VVKSAIERTKIELELTGYRPPGMPDLEAVADREIVRRISSPISSFRRALDLGEMAADEAAAMVDRRLRTASRLSEERRDGARVTYPGLLSP